MADERDRSNLLALIAGAVVLAVLVGGYFLFPLIAQQVSYQECIASGRITGC